MCLDVGRAVVVAGVCLLLGIKLRLIDGQLAVMMRLDVVFDQLLVMLSLFDTHRGSSCGIETTVHPDATNNDNLPSYGKTFPPRRPGSSYTHPVASDPDHPAEDLPAHSAGRERLQDITGAEPWPERVTREWALGGSTGAGVTVCVVDSGIEAGHPMIGGVTRSVTVSLDDDGNAEITDVSDGDVCGHGSACAGIIRSIAPDCELVSVRVLGEGFVGSGGVLVEGLRWAIDQGYPVINMSLSTTKHRFVGDLHDLADAAYFRRSVIVASAHNMPVRSYPWRFSSVISVASHDGDDPLVWYRNPDPPVEFYARGLEVEVAWMNGTSMRSTGNSFATPHISGICALILAKHPTLTPFELKTILGLTADNARRTA
jgi:subtilisin